MDFVGSAAIGLAVYFVLKKLIDGIYSHKLMKQFNSFTIDQKKQFLMYEDYEELRSREYSGYDYMSDYAHDNNTRLSSYLYKIVIMNNDELNLEFSKIMKDEISSYDCLSAERWFVDIKSKMSCVELRKQA